jgi:hypothetical protein
MKEKATKPKKRKSEINGNASPLKKKKESEEYTEIHFKVSESGDSHSDLGGFYRTILTVTLSSSPTKLRVRPESMIVDTLGGI